MTLVRMLQARRQTLPAQGVVLTEPGAVQWDTDWPGQLGGWAKC